MHGVRAILRRRVARAALAFGVAMLLLGPGCIVIVPGKVCEPERPVRVAPLLVCTPTPPPVCPEVVPKVECPVVVPPIVCPTQRVPTCPPVTPERKEPTVVPITPKPPSACPTVQIRIDP
jgi:hypothetical protein